MASTAASPEQETGSAPAAAGVVAGAGRRAARRRLEARDLALWLAAASSLLVWGWLVSCYWPARMPYDATSGVWTALADDWAHGVLYRPLHGALGYGGTRYMPLYFVLQGTLMRVGAGPVAAGAALTAASLVLFLAGTYAVLRALGVARARAAGHALLLPGFVSVQLLTLATRGDLLASALVLWGLQGVLRNRDGRAAGAWTLAFATKLTAVWAPLLLVGWLLLRGERRRAGRLLALVVGGVALVAGSTVLASDGRVLAAFAAVAAGGSSWRDALAAPWRLLYSARLDPFFLAVAGVALVLAARRLGRAGRDLPSLWAAGALLSSVLIFTTAGADWNHVLDLLTAAVLLLALEARPLEATLLALLFAAAQLLSQLPGMPAARHYFEAHGRPSVAALERSARRIPPGRPLLSQDPLFPLLRSERPEVSDAFSLRLLAARDGGIAREFSRKLHDHYYGAVIL
ncbi:MAG TPA: hypothetical protein VF832_00955, partial [Longimicrobiales bacterium]